MRPGAEFKPLAELLAPDPSSTSFAMLDFEAGASRHRELADTYAAVEAMALPESVPSAPRRYYDATRIMWVHGWYYYPIYTWAAFHAGACVEMGPRMRVAAEEGPKLRRQSLSKLLNYAVKREWLTLGGFSQVRAIYDGEPIDDATLMSRANPAVVLGD